MVNMKPITSSVSKKKGAGKLAPKGDTTSTRRSNAKIARWQAAAERDGFETWSQALTAWSKGEACLTRSKPNGLLCTKSV